MLHVDLNNVTDWRYLAEGKVHLIVAFSKSCVDKLGSCHCVLRIQKILSGEVWDCGQNVELLDTTFISNNMIPWFGNNGSISQSSFVQLSTAFVEELAIKVSISRPPNRIKTTPLLRLANEGYLDYNYNFMYKLSPVITVMSPTHYGHCLSFDFKVKCGLVSTSPFVPVFRSLKLQYNKFHLMQLYKLAKKLSHENSSTIQPAWGVFNNVSKYNPSDLCSRDRVRVMNALASLIQNPQNNLRICVDGKHVFGWEKSDVTAFDLGVICSHFLGQSLLTHEDSDDCCDVDMRGIIVDNSLQDMLSLIATVLTTEDTLQRLQYMQYLDLLDVEGAAVVFERLVTLCGSNKDTAILRLSDEIMSIMDSEVISSVLQHCLYASSSSNNAEERIALESHCPRIIRSLLEWRVNSTMSNDVREQHMQSAHDLISNASVEDCLLLLKLWMLALIAKDASVIVVLQYNANESIKFHSTQSGESFTVTPQTETCAGLIQVRLDTKLQQVGTQDTIDSGCRVDQSLLQVDERDERDSQILYCLSLVDIGLKDIDKVWCKAEEESENYRLYEQGEHIHCNTV